MPTDPGGALPSPSGAGPGSAHRISCCVGPRFSLSRSIEDARPARQRIADPELWIRCCHLFNVSPVSASATAQPSRSHALAPQAMGFHIGAAMVRACKAAALPDDQLGYKV